MKYLRITEPTKVLAGDIDLYDKIGENDLCLYCKNIVVLWDTNTNEIIVYDKPHEHTILDDWSACRKIAK